MSMPIASKLSRQVCFAVATSNRRNGPQPLVGSEPRKKFRHTDISGIIARSW
jgi:hypothetical protein